ncbi:MAG: hypothetical protein NZ898_04150 [Myxococcota bacterium]|nr:hypothetical protein [Myxococcota bacterium]
MVSLLVAALSIGCAAELPVRNYRPGDPRLRDARLEIVGPSTRTLGHGERTELEVRYLFEDGEPIVGAPIAFRFVGAEVGANHGARDVEKGADGHARVRLVAGSSDARFDVEAAAPEGEPVRFLVQVAGPASALTGSISIEMSYAGRETLTRFVPYLYRGANCETLAASTASLPPAERMGAHVARLTDRPGFVGVAPGADWTVAVVAESFGEIAGFGCTVGVRVEARRETLVSIEILDLAPSFRFEGTYDLNNQFDFAGALPPSVETAVRVLDELTDDQDIRGNPATEDWGQDPGAFVVDFAMRTTCAWECRPGENYASCSRINHGWGDIRAVYVEDFTSWSGAQPRFFGGCGAWELAARPAQQFVNMQIGTYVPEVVLRFIDAAGALARAVTNARIRSVLELRPAGTPDGAADFTHTLVSMEVRLRDLGGAERFFTFDLAEAGVSSARGTGRARVDGEWLVVPAHGIELSFAALVRHVWRRGLLPLFGFASTHDMLAHWIDCDAIADALARDVGVLSRGQYFDACRAGLEAAGDFVDDRIGAIAGGGMARLELSGRARGADWTTARVAQRLEMGRWMGSFREGAASGEVGASFTGALRVR